MVGSWMRRYPPRTFQYPLSTHFILAERNPLASLDFSLFRSTIIWNPLNVKSHDVILNITKYQFPFLLHHIIHLSQQVPSPITYLRWETFQSLPVLFQEPAPSSLAPIDTPFDQPRSKKHSPIYCTDLKQLEKRSPSSNTPSNPSSKSHWSSLVAALKTKLQQVPLLWTNTWSPTLYLIMHASIKH